MFEEFDAGSQTKVLRDADRVARALSHPRYVATDARTPQLAAREYLARYRVASKNVELLRDTNVRAMCDARCSITRGKIG
jgi:hypothetical protein